MKNQCPVCKTKHKFQGNSVNSFDCFNCGTMIIWCPNRNKKDVIKNYQLCRYDEITVNFVPIFKAWFPHLSIQIQ